MTGKVPFGPSYPSRVPLPAGDRERRHASGLECLHPRRLGRRPRCFIAPRFRQSLIRGRCQIAQIHRGRGFPQQRRLQLRQFLEIDLLRLCQQLCLSGRIQPVIKGEYLALAGLLKLFD